MEQQLLDLNELGQRLRKVDMLVVSLLKRRMDLALQVGDFKIQSGQDIYRSDIESQRIAELVEEANRLNLNPHFVAGILYEIIGESCKLQMVQLQDVASRQHAPRDEGEWYHFLKRNLLTLTEQWANSYDDDYDKAFFATHAYLEFEEGLLKQEISQLAHRDIALDLGCATGRLSVKIAPLFSQVVGYDLCPHMLVKANAKARAFPGLEFTQADLEVGIPQPDNSVSLVVMNLGTASDVRDIAGILRETERVLKQGGRFFFSFYNKDALLYQWDFVPWPVGLAAEINIHKHCLDVHFASKVLSVYARPYTVTEVNELFSSAMRVSRVLTHPTISSVLPNSLFEGKPAIQKSMTAIDTQLSVAGDGAYIIVTGQKQ